MSTRRPIFDNALRIECPNCGNLATWSERGEGVSRHLPETDSAAGKTLERWKLFQCQLCGAGAMFRFVTTNQQNYEPIKGTDVCTYPPYTPKVEPKAPLAVKAIFEQGLRCYGVQAWDAVCTMCRRSIEESLTERGVDKVKGEVLYKRIERAREILHLPPVMIDVAHRLRIIGNAGAHGEDEESRTTPVVPPLDQATEENEVFVGLSVDDADDSIAFCMDWFGYVYGLTQRLQAAKAKRPK